MTVLEALKEHMPEPIKEAYWSIRGRDWVTLRPHYRRRYLKYGLQPYAGAAYRALEKALGVYAYQPLVGANPRFFGPERLPVRECRDRWEAMKGHIPRDGSALDIGCQNGFFSFQMARHGPTTIGVEREETAYRICQLLALANEPLSLGFMQKEITPETIENLPYVDTILCLSVFHNWVREYGFEPADKIMRALAARTSSTLIFETGQADQTDASWARHMAFMGDDPKGWISDYLADIGFGSVEHIGTFEGTSKHWSVRHMFASRKS